jgi:hypothetical protein
MTHSHDLGMADWSIDTDLLHCDGVCVFLLGCHVAVITWLFSCLGLADA